MNILIPYESSFHLEIITICKFFKNDKVYILYQVERSDLKVRGDSFEVNNIASHCNIIKLPCDDISSLKSIEKSIKNIEFSLVFNSKSIACLVLASLKAKHFSIDRFSIVQEGSIICQDIREFYDLSIEETFNFSKNLVRDFKHEQEENIFKNVKITSYSRKLIASFSKIYKRGFQLYFEIEVTKENYIIETLKACNIARKVNRDWRLIIVCENNSLHRIFDEVFFGEEVSNVLLINEDNYSRRNYLTEKFINDGMEVI